MTFGELILSNKSEVRSNSNLTTYFIHAYKYIFGYAPSCAGCSINNEFNNLVKQVKQRNIQEQEIEINLENNIMTNTTKTFVLSPALRDDMLAYTDKNKVIRRKFVNKLTDEYVIAYLTNGTIEEIEERKKKFKVLPLELREKTKDKEENVLKTKAKKNK